MHFSLLRISILIKRYNEIDCERFNVEPNMRNIKKMVNIYLRLDMGVCSKDELNVEYYSNLILW